MAAMISLLNGCATTGENIQDAELLATIGEYEKAISSLRALHNSAPSSNLYKGELIRITNLSLSALSQQAEASLSSADYTKAQNLYMRALSIDPNYSKAKTGLETVQLRRKQKDLLALAERYLRRGNYQLADKQINQILSQNPSHPGAKIPRDPPWNADFPGVPRHPTKGRADPDIQIGKDQLHPGSGYPGGNARHAIRRQGESRRHPRVHFPDL
ncbi:hypothetical protein FQZ97_729560 [compost metagenome]